jgi:hypothetical protein
MKTSPFVWTCPACGKLVATELSLAGDAILVCSGCGKRFGEEREPPAEPRAATEQRAG